MKESFFETPPMDDAPERKPSSGALGKLGKAALVAGALIAADANMTEAEAGGYPRILRPSSGDFRPEKVKEAERAVAAEKEQERLAEIAAQKRREAETTAAARKALTKHTETAQSRTNQVEQSASAEKTPAGLQEFGLSIAKAQKFVENAKSPGDAERIAAYLDQAVLIYGLSSAEKAGYGAQHDEATLWILGALEDAYRHLEKSFSVSFDGVRKSRLDDAKREVLKRQMERISGEIEGGGAGDKAGVVEKKTTKEPAPSVKEKKPDASPQQTKPAKQSTGGYPSRSGRR